MTRQAGSQPYDIAVIGAGQLGSRHLQGLATLRAPCAFHILDPSQQSAETASTRFNEVRTSDASHVLHIHTAADTLPENIDLAIVATTADVRLNAIRALLDRSHVRNLLLEKVLFQRTRDYADAAVLIDHAGARCWVNCPRRIYSFYSDVKAFLADDVVRQLDVLGGEWGLGCNSVHFLDLLNFLTGVIITNYDTRALDAGVRTSKRAGFVEFTGTLRGYNDNTAASLSSIAGSSARHTIVIRGERKNVVIDEAGGRAWLNSGRETSFVEFSVPFQSQLTGIIAEQILSTGQCGLPEFAESAAIHLPFLRALMEHGGTSLDGVETCPIT